MMVLVLALAYNSRGRVCGECCISDQESSPALVKMLLDLLSNFRTDALSAPHGVELSIGNKNSEAACITSGEYI